MSTRWVLPSDRRELAFVAAALLLTAAWPASAHGPTRASAPPRAPFAAPRAGSYELPVIDEVSEHHLLDPSGNRAPLLALKDGQVAVVSFVYGACSDASGCPLALSVLQRFDRDLAMLPELVSRVRVVTVSFDPARDSPERMRALRQQLAPRGDWRFFTAADAEDLAPVLADYGQDVRLLSDPRGEPRVVAHLLRVFLVDDQQSVRNIYGAGFLDAEILRNDVATVLDISAVQLGGVQ